MDNSKIYEGLNKDLECLYNYDSVSIESSISTMQSNFNYKNNHTDTEDCIYFSNMIRRLFINIELAKAVGIDFKIIAITNRVEGENIYPHQLDLYGNDAILLIDLIDSKMKALKDQRQSKSIREEIEKLDNLLLRFDKRNTDRSN